MGNEILSNVGFADGEILDYFRDGSTVSVNVRAWNGQTVLVTFTDAIGIEDHGLGEMSAFVEDEGSTPLLERVLSDVYEATPREHPYRSYQFLNLDGEPRLEVIAQSAATLQK